MASCLQTVGFHVMHGTNVDAAVDDEPEKVVRLQPVLQQLPAANRETLKQLVGLCSNVVLHVDKNKMTASNLSIVLSPNLIYKRESDPLTMKTDMERGNSVVETMIVHQQELFSLDRQYAGLSGPPSDSGEEPLGIPSPGTSPSQAVATSPRAAGGGWARGVKPKKEE